MPLVDEATLAQFGFGTGSGLPEFDGGGNGITGIQSFIEGNQMVLVDQDGNFIGAFPIPQAPQGPFTGITEGQRQQIAQADRQLAAQIQQQETDLAEKRRQFNISTGLERERLAAEIRIAERQLQSTRQISQMDARTRLQIAQLQDRTTRRGQRLQLAESEAGLGARRAEFAAGALSNDQVRQAIFLLGGSGGTSPLEAAAQDFPTSLNFDFGPEQEPFDINAITQLPGLRAGGTLGPGEAAKVGEEGVDEIVVNKGNGQVEVIRLTKSAQGGGTFDLGSNISTTPARERARSTFSDILGQAFDAGPQPAFGGTGVEMEPLFGVDLKLPSQLAAAFPRLPVAVQNLIRQALGVRGINPEEFRRRRLAATPQAVFSGISGVRP